MARILFRHTGETAMAALYFFRRALCILLSAAIVCPLASYAQTSAPPAVPRAPSGQRLAPMVPLAGDPTPSLLIAQQASPAQAATPAQSGKELIAVLDLEAIGSDKVQASAMSDRLREELLKSGKYILVEREQMDAVLKEQAFQQAGCTSSECAVQVGKVLGVRKLVTGRVTKLDDRHWQLSANIIDVETAQTVSAESIRYQGDFFSLLDTGIGGLVAKLTAEKPGQPAIAKAPAPPAPAVAPAQPAKAAEKPSLPAIVQAAPPPAPAAAAPPAPPKEEEKKGISGWWWVAGGVVVVAVAVAAGSKSSGGSKSSSGCTSNCGTVGFSW